MQNAINKHQWVALFEALGLDPAAMMRWHTLFESRHPDGHQAFLEWLGLPPEEIAAVRRRAQA